MNVTTIGNLLICLAALPRTTMTSRRVVGDSDVIVHKLQYNCYHKIAKKQTANKTKKQADDMGYLNIGWVFGKLALKCRRPDGTLNSPERFTKITMFLTV